jgi:hypothetical protein
MIYSEGYRNKHVSKEVLVQNAGLLMNIHLEPTSTGNPSTSTLVSPPNTSVSETISAEKNAEKNADKNTDQNTEKDAEKNAEKNAGKNTGKSSKSRLPPQKM